MKALIFGINGQDGFYLKFLLNNHKVKVFGVDCGDGDWLKGDVADRIFVENLIKKIKPDYIFHFAANSTTRHEALFDNHKAISTGTLNILESVRLHSPKAKVFLSGSAVQFRNIGQPIDENTPFEASSAYSVARIQSVYASRYYRNSFGLKVYTGYLFNHDSPRRPERHVNQKIVMAVKRIATGSNEKLELGNINVKKEFNFAGDIVDAIWVLVNQEKFFELVIGSGKAYSIMEFIDCCFSSINKNWEDYVVIKKDYVPAYDTLVSNPRLIKSLGWEPKVDFYQLAQIMLKGE